MAAVRKIKCKICKKKKGGSSFSKSQLKKPKAQRKCIQCVKRMQPKVTKPPTIQPKEEQAFNHSAFDNANNGIQIIQNDTFEKKISDTKVDLSDAMFTNPQKIENLIVENQKYQLVATNKDFILCEIAKDCIMISGNVEKITVDNAWNMKKRNDYSSNLMCAADTILESLVKVCKSNKIRLNIKIMTVQEFTMSISGHQKKQHVQETKESGQNMKKELLKLNGMFTNKKQIEALIDENNKYQALATKTNGGTVVCDIGNDCIKISGDVGCFTNIREYLIDPELNLKQRVTNYPNCYWINNMCGPQLVLKELVKGCKFLKQKLDIRVVDAENF
eukprot:469666_1